ncbi:MAG: hypothetical protein JJD92_09405 [Frankiaceae bacterium]|nr:hypothetical protein [Frankiaceae bacterium]
MTETWLLLFPDAGAAGLPFARTNLDPDDAGERVLVHAAPPTLEVIVTDESGTTIARGEGLERHEEGPMSYLVRRGDRITLEDGWPNDDDIGRLVILPGGETGVLTTWWHAEDRTEWRWQVEFYNHT